MKSCLPGVAALTALSLVRCGGMNPTQLFDAPRATDAMTDRGVDDDRVLAAATGDDGGDAVTTVPTPVGPDPEAAAAPIDATVEGASPPPADDPDATRGTNPVDAGAGDSPANGGPRDGPGLPDADVDATDVCLNPPARFNAPVAATFEADDSRIARWSTFGGCLFEVTSARAHCGTHSGRCAMRVFPFQGPGYDMPPTAGMYTLSAWVLQDGVIPTSLIWNVKLVCVTNGATTTAYPPASAPVTAAPNTWVLTSGTFVVPTGCTTAQLYLNQLGTAPFSLPNLFADDVYVY